MRAIIEELSQASSRTRTKAQQRRGKRGQGSRGQKTEDEGTQMQRDSSMRCSSC